MSDEPLPCEDKLAFDDLKSANAAKAVAAWQHGEAADLKVYRCKHCSLWHLSSSGD